MRFPTINEVAAELRAINKQTLEPEDADEGIDVRLQVYPDGQWAVRWGSSDYDQDHRGFWGASSVPGNNRRFDSKDVARDLIDQAREHKATGGDEFDEPRSTGQAAETREAHADEDEEEEEDFDDDEDEDAPDDDAFSDEEMQQGYVITDSRRSGGYDVVHEHRHVGNYDDMDEALKAIDAKMERDKFYPNIYFVNERGNVDLLDGDGNVIESRT